MHASRKPSAQRSAQTGDARARICRVTRSNSYACVLLGLNAAGRCGYDLSDEVRGTLAGSLLPASAAARSEARRCLLASCTACSASLCSILCSASLRAATVSVEGVRARRSGCAAEDFMLHRTVVQASMGTVCECCCSRAAPFAHIQNPVSTMNTSRPAPMAAPYANALRPTWATDMVHI